MKPNENQKTFEALPIEVRNSALTTKQMGVLNVLYRMSTMETSKANPDGSFFASQATLMNETGYSNNTIIDVRSNFDECGFITTQKGTWEGRMATTYILHKDVVMEWAKSHPRIGAVKQRRTKKGAVISAVNKCTDAVNKCTDDETQTLREEIAQLREVITRQNQRISALEKALNIGAVKSNSNGAVIGAVMDKCTTESDTEKETNPILPYSNPIESNDYRDGESKGDFQKIEGNTNDGEVNPSNADEVVPSNEGDQTGSVSDFNEIEGGVDTFQPDKATPDDEQKTIDYLNELETTLRDSNTNLNHDEVIALAGELSANLNKWGQSSNVGKLTIDRSANLINWFVDDLTTLAEVRDIFASHLRSDNGNLNQIANNLTLRYGNLNPQDAGNAQIWAIATSDVQTTTDDPKGDQKRNKGANPVSGNTDLNPQDEETHQTSENKAAGSVSAPQMGELSTDDEKHAQNAPESPRMEMQEVPCIKAELTVWGRCEFDIHDNEMAESDADNAVNNLTKLIGCIKTVAELNWCEYYIGRAFKKWGWVLGTRYEMYHSNITRQLAAKRNELCAA